MKFNIGDTVRFLNETGGGKITRLDPDGYIYVMTVDGFEIPVIANELIVDVPAETDVRSPVVNNPAPPVEKQLQTPAREENLVSSHDNLPGNLPADTPLKLAIGFVPENSDAVFKTTIHCYLINDSDYYLYYRVGYQEQGNYFYLESGEVEPNTKCFLSDSGQTKLSKVSRLHIQALPVCKGHYYKIRAVDEEIDLGHIDFSKNHVYRSNEYFEENALVIEFAPAHKPQTLMPGVYIQEKEDHHENAGELKKKKPSVQQVDNIEVDLHIEALLEDHAHLSNSEILRIQMNRFRTVLEEAISKKARRVVFIHGVGNGILKMELRNELKRSYPEYSYQDASFKEYGFGATLVYLK